MTEENARKNKYLLQYCDCKNEVKELEDRLEALVTSYMSPGAKPQDGMPHAHGAAHDLSEMAVKIEEIREKLIGAEQKSLCVMSDIIDRINELPDPDDRRILMLRYVDGKTWEQVGEAMHITDRWAKACNGRALKKISIPEKSSF